jgi:hypothetical protein
MTKIQSIGMDEVVGYFSELEDPRSTVNRKHPLVSVVVIAMMAVLAGAAGPTAIARWAALKKEFLLKVLDLPHGIPGKDVFRCVLSLLKPGAFQGCFANWLGSLRAYAAEASGVDQPILAIDGKTLRRSHDHQKGLGALHSVSVCGGMPFGLNQEEFNKQQAAARSTKQWLALGGVCWGFLIMIIGPVVSRVYFEILIVIFRINTTLLDIRDNIKPSG